MQLVEDKLRQSAPAGIVSPLLLEGQQVLLHHTVKRDLFRLPPQVGRAWLRLDAGNCRHLQLLSKTCPRKLPTTRASWACSPQGHRICFPRSSSCVFTARSTA